MRGSRLKGKTYERKVGSALKLSPKLGTLYSGQWFKFTDKNGNGFAQPDFYIVAETEVWLFECKLSQKACAWPQMELLYKPLLEWVYCLPVRCVQVCKNLRYGGAGVVSGLRWDKVKDKSTLHWIGK